MQYLKADTAIKVVIGPVVAVGDGFTPVTTLSLSTADEAEILKHDAAAVTSISSNTFAAITSADGYYNLTITAAQLDTEGMLTVLINDDSLCLPVRHDFMVVNANVYDSLFAAATTDYLQVDTIQISGTSQTANDVGQDVNDILTDTADMQPKLGSPAGASMSADIAAVKTDTGSILADTGTDGVVVAAASKTGYALSAAGVDAVWDEATVGHVTAGTYGVAVTDILTDTGEIGAAGAGLTEAGGTGDHLTAIDLPDQTMNITGNITGNLSGSVGSVTGAVGSVTGAVGSVTGNVGGNVVGSVASVTGNVGGNVTGSVGSLATQAKADVNAECGTAISDASLATAAALATVDGIVDNLNSGIIYGSAATGTLSTTQATTDLTGYADDQLIGRVLIVLTGDAAGEATDITDSANTGGLLTFTATTVAMANGDNFKIV